LNLYGTFDRELLPDHYMFDFLKYWSKKPGAVWIGVLGVATLLLTGYTGGQSDVSNQPDSLDLASFVEPGFPFISTSVDARKLGGGFPNDNQAARTLALQLGNNAYACFDTDLLRWSVAWTGKFLPMVLMAQVSYKDFFNKNNNISKVTGDGKIATGAYAGWSTGKPVYAASDPNQPSWKALPASEARWNGVYVYGDKAILHYSVGTTNVFELPGSAAFEDQIAFTRTIQAGNVAKDIYLTAAEVRNSAGSEVKGRIAYVYQGTNKDTVTAVGILGKGKGSWEPGVTDGRYLTVRVPVSAKSTEATVVVWKGLTSQVKAFEKFCRTKPAMLPDFSKGGPANWKETVVTKGKLAPDTAAFVTDQLTLPLHNPWKRNVRVADMAFFKDGRAAVVTFEGDVWTIEGIDKELGNLKWKRFASGLHEPMSVEIVKDTIYVFDRNGIVRLNDLNHDGVADYYENFSNIMSQSAESREWAADLVYAPDGSFYIAKGGSLSNGPGMTAVAGKGFRVGSDQNGAILKISADGRKSEVIATGLRGPYLGLNPETGVLTASDQQGNFVPSTPIYLIKKGDYYGVEPTAHRTDNPPIAPPLTWIPHSIDRSSIGQAWVTGNKMGPLNGSLIHFSFGHPGLFRVLIDSASKVIQGGVSFINADYPAPTSKGVLNPIDGQMYVAGFNLWGSSSNGISALLRLRYTGKPSYMPNHFRAGKQGIVLGFDNALDAAAATDVKNFAIKRWDYKRTEEYGSGHFKLDGTTGEETLQVAASYLSADRKKILLLVPEMTEIMQMQVSYELKATDGHQMNDQFWFTVNSATDMDLQKYGFKNVDLALLTAVKPVETAPVAKAEPATTEKGKEVFQKMACSGCHSEGLRTKGMYGPPFQNLYKSQRTFDDGTTTVADENYLRESILTPSKHIVKGYNEEMPSFVGVLSDSDIESVILYIKSLSGK
jgi:glucose/arabinose dehydrogenase/cytochrome c2